MKANRRTDPNPPQPKRRHRRTEEELIEDLKKKITYLEQRKQLRAVKSDPVLKLAHKLLRSLKKAESQFVSLGRTDLANSVKASTVQIRSCFEHPA